MKMYSTLSFPHRSDAMWNVFNGKFFFIFICMRIYAKKGLIGQTEMADHFIVKENRKFSLLFSCGSEYLKASFDISPILQ